MQITQTTKEVNQEAVIENVTFKPVHPDAPLAPGPFSAWLSQGSNQTLYEEYTPNSSRDHKSWKDFQHFKSEAIGNTVGGSYAVVTTGVRAARTDGASIAECHLPYFGYYPATTFGSACRLDMGQEAPMYVPTQNDGFVPPPENLGQLTSMALKSMLPKIKAELSLVNSIYELKDLSSLKTYWNYVKGKITEKGIIGMIPKSEKPLKYIVQGLAGNYLQWSFNLRPLLSDISGIYTALTQVEAMLNDFLTRAGRVQRRHFAYNWMEMNASSDTTLWRGLDPYSEVPLMTLARFTRQIFPKATTFHAQIEYNYNFTRYQTEHARLLALLDMLGVNLNPAIIWNAIKWSFVVDWVIGVGRWLDDQKIANMEPQINIRQFLWSVKRERMITLRRSCEAATEYATPNSPITPSESSLPSVVQTSYRRSAHLPAVDSITSSGLTLKEFSLGASLVIANRRPRRRRRR